MILKGQKISDRYEVLKNIGEGGMANVYLAYDTILDRNVAVKVLRGDLSSDEKFVRRFQREALAASSLTNPNIVEVYDVGQDGDDYYIVMEYIEGKHLKDLLKKRGSLTVSEVVDIALQITNGLSVAHDSYIIHRDIKPQNILILENGLCKITDFGIAVALNSTQLTQTNSVMGSVHYLPPEQACGKGATLQSDIYSMGILIYELLTGKLPFKGESAVEIALKHLKEPMPDIKEILPSVPQALANIITKATSKNPKNRYIDAREMHEDLKTCLKETRKNEPKIVLKYPETDYDETKIMKTVSSEKNEKKEKETSDVKIKKITKDDLEKQNKTLVVLGSIFTALIVIITTIVVLVPKITSSSQIKVPDVTGKSETEAVEILQNAGFSIANDKIEQASDNIENGKIIKTSPVAGTQRKKGFEITLYVSIGSDGINVENYIGKNSEDVKNALTNLGIIVEVKTKSVEENVIEKYKENEIIEQSVEEGKTLKKGESIILYIPKNEKLYPDFKEEGYSADDVQLFADKYNLNLTIEYVETTNYENGVVYYQSRTAGDTVVSGATLKIKVAKNGEEEILDEDGCPSGKKYNELTDTCE